MCDAQHRQCRIYSYHPPTALCCSSKKNMIAKGKTKREGKKLLEERAHRQAVQFVHPWSCSIISKLFLSLWRTSRRLLLSHSVGYFSFFVSFLANIMQHEAFTASLMWSFAASLVFLLMWTTSLSLAHHNLSAFIIYALFLSVSPNMGSLWMLRIVNLAWLFWSSWTTWSTTNTCIHLVPEKVKAITLSSPRTITSAAPFS